MNAPTEISVPGRVAVLGMGLIGGSFALALSAADAEATIVGHDPDAEGLAAALERGVIHEAAGSAEAAVAGAGLVVLAMPVDLIPAACRALAGHVHPNAAVTDVGSAKLDVVTAGEEAFGGRFVGGHPMAGSERHGIDAADPELFGGAWWILTPTEQTSSDAYARVRALVGSLKALPVALDPSVHDALIARLSHVPQLAASALVSTAAAGGDREELLGLAAGGFRDVTRIAASSPELWVAILRSNRSAVLEGLGGLRDSLADLEEMIAAERWDDVREYLAAARTARLELFARPDPPGEPVTLAIPVQDRPGLLAEVTTAAGRLGANIEDLRIIHSTEGGQGRLEMVIAGAERAAALAEELRGLGYRVEELPPGVESYG